MPRRGFIYAAALPGDKRRPVLVISPDARNEKATDVIVLPISTTLRTGPWHVRLPSGDGGVKQASIIKCEQMTTLRQEYLAPEPMGPALAARQLAAVERAILRAIGIAIWD
jgi:mRNA-degrading endonuclease toxin of MazEF toxin-antitoxin module